MASKPYKRGDSPYWYVDYTNAEGRRVRESTDQTDFKLAKDVLHDRKEAVLRERERRSRGIPGIAAVKVADAFAIYLETQRPHWAPRYTYQVQHSFASWIMPAIGGPDALVCDATRPMVEAMRLEMQRMVKGATINRVNSAGSKFFKWCLHPDRHYAAQNPFASHEKYREEKMSPPELDDEQLARWVECIAREDLKRAAIVSLDTGLRFSELRRVRRSDLFQIDGAGQPLWVLQVVSSCQRATKDSRGTTKNDTERLIPLTTRAASAIHAQLAGPGKASPSDEPFAGIPVKPAYQMSKAFIAAELPRFRWHDMRHYALTGFANRGLDRHDLKQVAGWTTMAMADRYIHPNIKAAAAAVAQMNWDRSGTNGSEKKSNRGTVSNNSKNEAVANHLDLQ
jgi:integrase